MTAFLTIVTVVSNLVNVIYWVGRFLRLVYIRYKRRWGRRVVKSKLYKKYIKPWLEKY